MAIRNQAIINDIKLNKVDYKAKSGEKKFQQNFIANHIFKKCAHRSFMLKMLIKSKASCSKN